MTGAAFIPRSDIRVPRMKCLLLEEGVELGDDLVELGLVGSTQLLL